MGILGCRTRLRIEKVRKKRYFKFREKEKLTRNKVMVELEMKKKVTKKKRKETEIKNRKTKENGDMNENIKGIRREEPLDSIAHG